MLQTLTTPRGETLSGTPWQIYPRPQMRRDSYINLNGEWDFAVSSGKPETFDMRILVPFCPESRLSGIGRHFEEGAPLWYRRRFLLPEGFRRKRVLLHIGAADQIAEVFVNGQHLCRHEGGYAFFCVDITEALAEENELVIRCTDDLHDQAFPYGKQVTNRGGMWYTPVSGIWQTVWLESVSDIYIEKLNIENHGASVTISTVPPLEGTVSVEPLGQFPLENGQVTIAPENPHFWCPDDPYLYRFTVETAQDKVESYFAIRSLEIKKVGGYPRLCLNGKSYFFHGLLDQGYWPEGLYTPPSDAAVERELSEVKALGYNLLRKHAKIEPQRWYYHCDRLGLVVWQDMVNGGSKYNLWFVTYLTNVLQPLMRRLPDKAPLWGLLSRGSESSREEYRRELEDTVQALRCHPCVGCWVPFNEGWGQYDAAGAVQAIRALDDTRLVDEASGWYDQGGGDVYSLHNYFYPLRVRPQTRTVALSEYGGIAWPMPGHEPPRKTYGYGTAKSREELTARYKKMQLGTVLPQLQKGLSALVYTQLTDVEDEVNGLFTYDRTAIKPDANAVRSVNAALAAEFAKVIK